VWDGFLWCACFAPDEKRAAEAAERIMCNYSGPSLSSISSNCLLAEFVTNTDGQVRWIYHPFRLKSWHLITPDISSAVDAAIRKSGPLPSCGFRPGGTFALMYSPARNPAVWLGGSDHPSQFVVRVSKKNLKRWASDAWAERNRREILKHFQIPKSTKVTASVSYWFCLNPDGTIEKQVAIPVSTGRGKVSKNVKVYEKMLGRAIEKSKFVYQGAPAVPNQPVGVVVLYRPTGALHVFPYLFDVVPWEAEWVKD